MPHAPYVAPPGRVVAYCNLGIDLAGYVEEITTGKSFPVAVQEQVLVPLQMQHHMLDYAAANPAGQVMVSTRDLASFAEWS